MIKRNIVILCAISLLQGMVFYAPVATLYRQAAGLGVFHITLMEGISLFLTICLEIPWGWAADRIGYKKTMLICCGLYFVSKIVFWQAESFGGFLLERIMLSVVCAGLSGVDSAMLYLSCGADGSHRAFSLYQNLGQLGILLAGGVYALWIGTNYRLAAFCTVLSYGAAALLALRLKEVPRDKKKDSPFGKEMTGLLRRQLGSRKNLLLLIAMALLAQTHQTITVFLSQLQYVRTGMGNFGISLAYLLVSFAGLAGGSSACVCRKTGAKAMGTACMALACGSCFVLAVSVSPFVSVLSVLLLRVCFSLMEPLSMDLQNQQADPENRAAALSINAVVQDSLGIFLNLIYGYLADIRLPAAMLLGAVLCGISAFSFRRSR